MQKIFRIIAFGSAICIGLSGGASLFAQDSTAPSAQGQQGGHYGGPHGPMSPDQELGHMTKALNLTSDQQTQLKPILQDRHDQQMQIHQDASLSRDAKMSKMKSLDDDSNSKVEAVLNPDQKAKYEKMIADRKEHMQERRAQNSGAGDTQPQQ